MSNKYFAFVEENDWEGETWRVGIKVEEGTSEEKALIELGEQINRIEDSGFAVSEITESDYTKYEEYDEETGYFPAYMTSPFPQKTFKIVDKLKSTPSGSDYEYYDVLSEALYKLELFAEDE